jgi:hypothetical protein
MWAHSDTDTTAPALPELDQYQINIHRIGFEAHAKGLGLDLTRTTAMCDYFGIDYLAGLTEATWQGWKMAARARL